VPVAVAAAVAAGVARVVAVAVASSAVAAAVAVEAAAVVTTVAPVVIMYFPGLLRRELMSICNVCDGVVMLHVFTVKCNSDLQAQNR
jgi:hypothetical protein